MPQTRTPDAHFFTEVRYKGTKTVAVTPDYSEVAKLSDLCPTATCAAMMARLPTTSPMPRGTSSRERKLGA